MFSSAAFLRHLFLEGVHCVIAFDNLFFMNGYDFHVCILSFGVHGYQTFFT